MAAEQEAEARGVDLEAARQYAEELQQTLASREHEVLQATVC